MRTRRQHRPPAAARRSRRAGLIMPLVLLALAVAVVLGSCFLTSASTSTSLSTAAADRLRARMIAESGLAMALSYVEKDVNWRTNRVNGAWVTNESFAGGTFSVWGEDGDRVAANGTVVGDGSLSDDRSDPVVITCVGTYKGNQHLVRGVRYPPKASNLAVNERVELKGTGLLDSYNPDIGPYSASNSAPLAVARSNGALRTSYVKLRNNARVNGNVYFGPGGSAVRSVQQDGTAVVTGTIGALPAAVVMPAVTEPAWPVLPTGVTRAYSSGINVINADTWLDRLDVTGTGTLRVLGNVNLYVSGPMTVSDDAKIEVGYPMAVGVAAAGAISLRGGPVDSYDSSLGPYGGTNVGANAVIATNSTAAGAIDASATINGDAFSGTGSVPATAIVGTVTGTKAALTSAIAIPAPAAMPTNLPPSVGDVSVTSGTTTLTTDYQAENISVSGGAVLKIVGQRVVRVNGNFSVNSASLDISDDASLTIYVGGSVSIGGNGSVFNATTSPPRFTIISTGTGSISMSGSSKYYVVIDAPRSAVSLGGGATLYGAVMAASISTGGGATIHTDKNPLLVDMYPRLAATWSPGSKLTLYTNDSLVIQNRAKVNYGPRDPSIAIINHLGARPLQVTGTSLAYARTTIPDARMEISGAAQWTGKIRARDLLVAGTATVSGTTSGAADPVILVDETVEVKDSAVLSGTSTTGTLAILASNGATDYTIDVRDTAAYRGDGYISPGGTAGNEIRVATTATYTGAKSALTLPVRVAALPTPPPQGVVSDRTVSGSTTETITGDLYYKTFVVRDDATLQVSGDARLILTGDFCLYKNARIVLRPGARLTVHCPGNVRFTGNVRANVDGQPRALTLNCTTAPEIEIRGTSKVCATLLAPAAQLMLADTGEFFGAFTGRRAKVDGGSKFHCAQNLTGPVTWLEQE